MAKEKNKESPLRFFVNYVSNRNVDIITKSEWESLYFYCVARKCFPKKNLISLETSDLYKIGEVLNLDFSKVSSLLRKCYRFESDRIKKMSFEQLFESSSILNPICDDAYVKFGIVNSLVQCRMEELFNMAGVFSDTSFNKNIFTVPAAQFLRLVETEEQTLITKLRKKAAAFVAKISETIKDSDQSKIKEIQSLINSTAAKNAAKSIVDVLSGISTITGSAVDIYAKMAMETLNDLNIFKHIKHINGVKRIKHA